MNEVPRIAHVIGKNAKGGVESVVFNYYKFIDKSKIQFDFIIHNDSPFEIPAEILNLGCKVYKIPPYKRLYSYIKALTNIFAQGNYKIVHSHMSTISVFALFAAKKTKIPVRIAHSHVTAGKGRGEFFRNTIKYILRRFSKLYPTHLFSCSEHAGKWLFGKKSFEKGKITVLNNAIDLSGFFFNREFRNKIRNDLGLENKFVIGNVGRFMPQKNHAFLVEIFYEAHKKDNDCILLLIGAGELKNQIEEKVKILNIESSVIFLGARDDVNELYQAMDVFVLPSLYEGLGMVVVEAQVAGLPTIVSTEVPAEAKLFDIIEFLSLRDAAKTWAERILAKRDFPRVDVSGESYLQRFSIAEQAKKLETIYERLISGDVP